MKKVILSVVGLLGLLSVGCHDVAVGYLRTEEASYVPDSMIVKRVLDNDPGVENPMWSFYLNDLKFKPIDIIRMGIKERINTGEDYERDRLQLPWLSTKIQGIKGTMPIHVQVKKITSENGDPEEMLKLLTVRGDGMLILPTDVFSIPEGRYKISLNFCNEGYSKDVENIFTIIVK
ncbi:MULTISPECIES: hypothetical protein [Butyricimonas]|uniref:hypothetical protein n=1 Tax=Butyricimonas TaxID=574697 RepID=UPI0007FB2CB5|nr:MULTISPECIES: hypothetical protein [Butyricimonas]